MPKTPPGGFPIAPPVEPMLAKLTTGLPPGEGWLFEPKWDGFRAIVFRDGEDVYIQSRDLKPLDRYFPELPPALRASLPARCVVDGEVVIAGPRGLDFDALQLRLHPAASRAAKLAAESPASFVAFDLLADEQDLREKPQAWRRARLEEVLAGASGRVLLTPCTRDREVAGEWFSRFEGAGFDGVIAKREDATYQPGKRAMIKVKHERTADCAVAGFRWHKQGPGQLVGSLLLGLYDAKGALHHVGVTSAFSMARRRELAQELAPLRERAIDDHPWREWAAAMEGGGTRMPGGQSRWSQGKDLSWEPVRLERVCEVKYDHLQGDRFRHAAVFVRWRPDKRPRDCRYDQLEVTPPAELAQIFARPGGR
jgi:ATP-dependent DNA ligase